MHYARPESGEMFPTIHAYQLFPGPWYGCHPSETSPKALHDLLAPMRSTSIPLSVMMIGRDLFDLPRLRIAIPAALVSTIGPSPIGQFALIKHSVIFNRCRLLFTCLGTRASERGLKWQRHGRGFNIQDYLVPLAPSFLLP